MAETVTLLSVDDGLRLVRVDPVGVGEAADGVRLRLGHAIAGYGGYIDKRMTAKGADGPAGSDSMRLLALERMVARDFERAPGMGESTEDLYTRSGAAALLEPFRELGLRVIGRDR